MTTDDSDAGMSWAPDLRTLRWAAEQVESESLARAIAHDVPLRMDVPPDLPFDVWRAAADAAYEATWWPIIRIAEELGGRRDVS